MLSDDYVLGLVEGEGCFSIGIVENLDNRVRKTTKRYKVKNPFILDVKAWFRITMVVKDTSILKEIQKTLGVGLIRISHTRKGHPNWSGMCEYYAVKSEEIDKVVEYFKEKKFVGNKGKDFELWRKCIEIIKANKPLQREHVKEIALLRDRMNLPKRGWKYKTVEEVLKIWDRETKKRRTPLERKGEKKLYNT